MSNEKISYTEKEVEALTGLKRKTLHRWRLMACILSGLLLRGSATRHVVERVIEKCTRVPHTTAWATETGALGHDQTAPARGATVTRAFDAGAAREYLKITGRMCTYIAESGDEWEVRAALRTLEDMPSALRRQGLSLSAAGERR